MMLRTAVYCRYSTDLQDETSIEDQARLCRDLAKRMSWGDPIRIYADAAISGASRHNRPDYLRMIADLEAGMFDALIVENLSRLTRDMEDSAFTMKRAAFHGVKVYCANESGTPLSSEMAAFHAIMAEMARKDGARMIHRAMTGWWLRGSQRAAKATATGPKRGVPTNAVDNSK